MTSSSKLSGQRILIIGGSSGIGFAVASEAVAQGAIVILSSSNATRLSEAKSRLTDNATSSNANAADGAVSGRVHTIPCALDNAETLDQQLHHLFQTINELLPSVADGSYLNHIVFTAGPAPTMTPIADLSLPSAQHGSVTRFWAPLLMAKHASSMLAKSPESSITLTSGAAAQKVAGPGWSVSAGLSAGVEGVARALAVEMRPVRVNCVSPGVVKTEMWNPMPKEMREATWDMMAKGLLTGRVGVPEDVAQAYVYLMKDCGITGASMQTNGGLMLS